MCKSHSIINVYAPTEDKSGKDKELFYTDPENVYGQYPKWSRSPSKRQWSKQQQLVNIVCTFLVTTTEIDWYTTLPHLQWQLLTHVSNIDMWI